MNQDLRNHIARGLLIGAFIVGSGLLVRAIAPQDVGTWRLLDVPPDIRVGAASVALGDGRVVIAGGAFADTPTDAVLVFNPADGSRTTVGHMVAARVDHTATLLTDGRVLIAGGRVDGLVSADLEIFDPASGSSVLAASLAQPRTGHSAARLPDGRVLIAGGTDANGVLDTIEIFNAADSAAIPSAVHMNSPRSGASATVLLDGRVLIAGGNDGQQDLATAELFDPWALIFTQAPTGLSVARSGHAALLLPDNNSVLIAGGTSHGVPQQAVDLFLPAQFPDPYSYGMGAFAPAAPLNQPRARAVAAGQSEGYAFVTGGGAADAESFRFSTIKTDRDDYAPGRTAVITGSGWQPETDVTLLFQEDPAVHDDYELHVKTDAAGNLYWDQWAPEQHDLNVRFYLLATQSTATGERRAQITFTDSTNVSTNTSLDALPSSLTSGQANVAFSGDVTVRSGDPVPPAGGPVQLQMKSGSNCTGSMTQVVTVTTSAGGHFSGTFAAPLAAGSYSYRTEYQGDTQGSGNGATNWQKSSSSCRTLPVTGPTATALVAAPASGTYGSSVSLTATLTSGGSGVSGKSIAFTLNGASLGTASTNSSGVASLTGVSLTTIDAGLYPAGVGASFAGDVSFLPSSNTASLTVNRADQASLTVNVPNPGVFNTVYTLTTAGGKGTGGVTYGVGTSDACSLNGDQLTVTMGSGGVCAVTATKAADTNYNQAASAATPVTLAKAEQAAVSVSAPATGTYGQTGLSASASGGSGSGAFSYSAGSSTACSINASAGAITILSGTGTCSLTASRAGDANYADSAASSPATVTIQKATLTVTPDGGKSKTYGQTFSAFTGTVGGLVNGDAGIATYVSAGAAANASVGNYDITSTFAFTTGSADNYDIQNKTATSGLTVNKAHVTATAGNGSATYDGNAHAPSACVVSGAFTGDLTCGNDPATVGPNAGTTAIAPVVNGTGLSNFDVAPVGGTFTIEQAASVTTVTCPATVTYTGSALTPCSASVTGAGGLQQTLTVNYTGNTNAGTAQASASFAGDANHLSSTDQTTFTIEQAVSVTTVTCPATVTYTGSALTPCSASVTGAGGLQQTLTVNYTGNTNAGPAQASANFAGDANHLASADQTTFTVEQAVSVTTLTCSATVTYTGSALTPCSASVSGAGGLQQTLTVSYTGNTNAGTAQASASFAGDVNHLASGDQATFTIEPAASVTTVTCPATVTYTGSALTPCSASVTGAGGLQQTLTVNYTDNTNAGTAHASASFAGDANHLTSGDQRTFTIEPAASVTKLTCQATAIYTQGPVEPCSAWVTGAGGLNASVVVNYAKNVTPGIAEASATFAGDANHLPSSDRATFVIGFNVCALYDQTKAVKQNATVPVKFFLCDSSGRDVSSAGIVVNAVSLTPTAGSLTGVVEDAGNANPDNNFRFDPTLGPSGGYIFNLSTKGLGGAIWNLSFTVGGQTFSTYKLAFGVK